MTLRLRLTLLYGACFLVAGAALLAITYGLVAGATSTQSKAFFVSGHLLNGKAPLPGSGSSVSSSRGGAAIQVPAPPAPALVGAGQVRALQRTSQRQIDLVVSTANQALKAQRAQTRDALLTKSGVALGIMALLSVALGYLLAGRTLRPLRIMSGRARAITEENLHEGLGFNGRSDELGELAAAFDALLARLERAFDSQRRFVANASHELRTPITLERALVEVALSDPNATVESLSTTCQRVLATTEQQERVIEALLTLARSQAGVDSQEPLDLASLVSAGLDARALDGIPLELALHPAPIQGDRALLERMVANLLDNAVRHNDATAPWLRVRTWTADGRAELEVANGGAVVPAEATEELFEPFRRLEGERTTNGGLGLGLSIVRAIAHAHGGEAVAQPLPDGGLELCLTFPASPQETAAGGTSSAARIDTPAAA